MSAVKTLALLAKAHWFVRGALLIVSAVGAAGDFVQGLGLFRLLGL